MLQDSLTYKSDLWKKDRLSYYLNTEELNPDDYNALFNRGLKNLRNELYEEALSDFKATLDANIVSTEMVPSLNKSKHKSESNFYIGVCFELLDKQDSAKFYLAKAIEINPYYDDAYIEYASIELRNGRAGKALETLSDAYDKNPKSRKLLINLAAMYMENSKMSKAKKLLKSAEDQIPGFADPFVSLAMIYSFEEKYNLAEIFLDKALAIDSTITYALFVKGLYKFYMKEYEEAYAFMDRFYDVDSTNPTANFYLGVLQLKFGNSEKGFKNIYSSLKSRFDQTNTFDNEGYAFLEMIEVFKEIAKNPDEEESQILAKYFSEIFTGSAKADGTWEKYINKYPVSFLKKRLIFVDEYFSCFSKYATFCNKLGLIDDANSILSVDDSLEYVKLMKSAIQYSIEHYAHSINESSEIIDLDPANRFAYFEKARACIKLKRYEEALASLDTVLTRYPQYIDAENLRANLYAEFTDNQHKAIEGYKKVWELQPFNPEPTECIGKCYTNLNMSDSAIFFYNISIDLNDRPYSTVFLRGIEYYTQANYDTAMMDFNVCINIGSEEYLKSLVYRGFCYSALGQHNKALKDLNTVLAYENTNGTLYYNIGFIYLNQGNYKKANKYFDDGMLNDPEYKWNYYGKARCLNAEGEYKSSIMFSLQATYKDSTFAEAYLVAADDFYEIGKFTQSYHFYKKAAELDYSDYTASFNTGLCMLRLGMMDNALKIYSAYSEIPDVQKHPDYQEAIEKLKFLVENNIQKEDAMRILSEVFDIDLYSTDIANE